MWITEAKVEVLRRFGRPQAHGINHIVLVAGDRIVIWQSKDDLILEDSVSARWTQGDTILA